MSFSQQRLWFIQQVEPHSPAYNIAVALRVRGRLRHAALEQAVQGVVERHDVLRTALRVHEGRPVQVVLPAVDVVVRRIDLADLSTDDGDAAAMDLLRAEAREPFDLETPPLLRVSAVRLAPDRFVVGLCVHHAVSDGWSMRVLAGEIAAGYAAAVENRLPEPAGPPLTYRDFARWQRSTSDTPRAWQDLEFWRTELAGLPPMVLPADRLRPPRPTGDAAAHHFEVPARLMARLGELARAENATLFMVLLAGWQVLLARHSGQLDFAVGVPAAGRVRAKFAGVMGCFVNTLVLRSDLAGAPTLQEVVRRVRRTALAAYRHSGTPFERIVDVLRVPRQPGRGPLVDVMFSFREDVPVGDLLSGTEVELADLDTGSAKFDLTLEVVHADPVGQATIRYTTDLFDADTVRRMADHLKRLLAALTEQPGQPFDEVDLTTEAERAVLRLGIGRPGPAVVPDEPVHAAIEEQARQRPDAVAVLAREQRVSYGRLNADANRLAHRLRSLGVGPETRVGVFLGRDAMLVTAILAVLKAGGGYVLADPVDPDARVTRMFATAEVRVVLTAGRLAQRLDPELTVFPVDEPDGVRDMPTTNPPMVARPDHLAYVVFTSGSTGAPKGIAVEHRQLHSYLVAVEAELEAGPGHVHAAVSSISGDLWLTALFPALRTGGALRLVPGEQAFDPAVLADRFGRSPCDYLKITPSHLRVLMSDAEPAAILPRRALVLGGEPLPWELVDRVRDLTDCLVVNSYGPAETAVAVLVHRLPPGPVRRRCATVPLTAALGANRVLVLDERLRLTPTGVPGELFVGGPQVTRGYVGLPDLTSQRFLPDPYGPAGARIYRTGDRARLLADGGVEILGRTDRQVKIRGFLVQPAEIEAVLGAHENVESAAVLAGPTADGDTALTAYVVCTAALEPAELREHVRRHLPAAFVPSAFVPVPALPVTGGGKLDHSALRAVPIPARKVVAPATEVERALAVIWAELLPGERIGVDDNFFDVGGHSLLLVPLQHHIGERLGREVPVLELMRHTTIRGLARYLTGDQGAESTTRARDRGKRRLAARRARGGAR